MFKFKGTSLSKGISYARPFMLKKPSKKEFNDRTTSIYEELEILDKSISKTTKQIEKLKEKNLKIKNKVNVDILNAHLLILNDPEYISNIKENIKTNSLSAASAIEKGTAFFVDIFNNIEDEYFKQRSLDIKDIGERLISNIFNTEILGLNSIDYDVIILAEELLPSQTIMMDTKYIKGIIVTKGGKTSHTAIIANNLALPAILCDISDIVKKLNCDSYILLDALKEEILVDPNKEHLDYYFSEIQKLHNKKKEINKFNKSYCLTKDLKKINLLASLDDNEDLNKYKNINFDGIGLYRTEFLFMNSKSLPSEEQQYNIYKKILTTFSDKKVTIRTLDIGADKNIDYLSLKTQDNPFLGTRGIRLSLKEHKKIFITQIRALIKASKYGKLNILLPMISTVEELLEAKKIIKSVENEITCSDIKYNYKIGMMLEVPSAAICIDSFIDHSDFFSIGTNDLLAYLLAVDRNNSDISYLYNPYTPSLIKTIYNVINAVHKKNKIVGICGELASDFLFIPLLIGMGIDYLTVNYNKITEIKYFLHNKSLTEMIKLKDKLIQLNYKEEIVKELKKFINE